ncbi:MAG: hypothetical protein ACOZIN_03305 [Myxococcota bacterium]
MNAVVRAALASFILSSAAAWAEEEPHHFADRPIATLSLVQTVVDRGAAMVEAKDGSAVIIHEGELLGREAVKVLEVGRGCLSLLAPGTEAPALLCIDERSFPQS